VVARPTPEAFYTALPFVVVGELIRIWSSGYLTKLSGLVTAGPFALCRNPLYVGSFLISLGYMLMCHNPIVLVVGAVIFWMLHGGAVAYEEKLLCEHFGEDYAKYCREVPRFIPRPRSLTGQGSFSFQRAMGNDEFRGAAFLVLFVSCFGVMAFGSFSVLNWLSSLAS
jgi:hypothetical protein